MASTSLSHVTGPSPAVTSQSCKRLGLALNISDYHLDNIEHSSHRNVEEWCLTMLSDWLRGTAGDGPVTWERLVEAMEDARCGELAQQVKTALQLCCCATGTSL